MYFREKEFGFGLRTIAKNIILASLNPISHIEAGSENITMGYRTLT